MDSRALTVEEFLEEWNNASDKVLVHTSGSTGKPKPMWVEKRRMEASARITCQFLGLKEGDRALLCLPVDYIAGKMMVVRSVVWSLHLTCLEPSNHPFAASKLSESGTPFDLVAMVPSQVYSTLQVPQERERLRQTRHLIIGGGAVDEALQQQLRDFPNFVWSTYGMTETLSHIAMRRINTPDSDGWYAPLPGVTVSTDPNGCLVIDAPAVHDGPLVTNDIATIDNGRFRILGRRDNVICSGGIKIQIEEVERLLRPHLCAPFVITKAPDERFGQQVVLLTEQDDVQQAAEVCRRVLPKYWQPRRIFSVDRIPMTATGKPARAEAEKKATGLVRLG